MHAAKALESGEGIDADPGKAAVLYKAACKLGDDAGCESFARLRSTTNATGEDDPPSEAATVDLPKPAG